MNRTCIIVAPPLAFILAAVSAWLVGPPSHNETGAGFSVSLHPRQHATDGFDSVSSSAVLQQLEHEVFFHPVPVMQTHDAQGMDAAIESDDRSPSFPGSGGNMVGYAMKWAAQAPEEMFAWLVRKNGSSFQRELFPTYLLFGEWAKNNMEAALAAVDRIPDRRIKAQALFTSLESLCQNDPERARRLMIQNLDLFTSGDPSPITKCYETGKPMCDLLLSLPAGGERTSLLAKLLRDMAGWNAETQTQAQAVWERSPEPLRQELVAAGFVNERYGVDKDKLPSFDGLADLLKQRAEASGDPAAVRTFLDTQGPAWAKTDLSAALEWTQDHLKGKNRVERGAELFGYAAAGDFDPTLDLWHSLPDGYLKIRAAGAIANHAPADRKADAQAVLDSLSEHDRLRAR